MRGLIYAHHKQGIETNGQKRKRYGLIEYKRKLKNNRIYYRENTGSTEAY